jgi:hypothetical protein
MAFDRNALFKKILDSKANAGGTPIRDGKYRFLVKANLMEEKFGGTFWITEFHVLQSSKVTVVDLDSGAPIQVEPNAPGSTCSFAINMITNKSAGGNVKQYVLALLGYQDKEDSVDGEDFMKTLDALTNMDPKRIDPDTKKPIGVQIGRGFLIDNETFRKKIKGGTNIGKPITCNKFAWVEQDDKMIADNRKFLDGLAEKTE